MGSTASHDPDRGGATPSGHASGLKDPKRSASRIAKYNLAGWIGIQDTPEDIAHRRGEIERELEAIGSTRSLDDGFDMFRCRSRSTISSDLSKKPAQGQRNVGVSLAAAIHLLVRTGSTRSPSPTDAYDFE